MKRRDMMQRDKGTLLIIIKVAFNDSSSFHFVVYIVSFIYVLKIDSFL